MASFTRNKLYTVKALPHCDFLLTLNENNEFQLKTFPNPQAAKPKEKYSGSVHNQIVNNINSFGAKGGFDKILGLLKWQL